PIVSTNFHNDFWRPALEAAGLGPMNPSDQRLHFHALRHFCASWWLDQGLPIMEVASLLGHASFDLTVRTYAHAIVGGHGRIEVLDRMANNLLRAAADVPALSATSARQSRSSG